MKLIRYGLWTTVLSIVSTQVIAIESADATRLVQRYAELVACQTSTPGDYRPNEYKAVEISLESTGLDNPAPMVPGTDALWVVYWVGNIGCVGGPATVPHFTTVSDNYYAGRPILRPHYEIDTSELVLVDDISSENGVLVIEGVTYGPGDEQQPTEQIEYRFRPGYDGFERVN